jgi:hypothetical protein
VGAGLKVLEDGAAAVPGQRQHCGQVGADQDERVVAGQDGLLPGQLAQGLMAVDRRAQRELAPGTAGAGRGLRAAGVQDAGDPRDVRVQRQPGAARLLVQAAGQR